MRKTYKETHTPMSDEDLRLDKIITIVTADLVVLIAAAIVALVVA